MATTPNSPLLAKLRRPRLHGAAARERLFALLDARERYAAVWVAGPPGAGKTTLVASWLQSRKLKSHWYQVDAGDTDPASLFFYLGELAKSFASQAPAPLPYLTPEFRDRVAHFARRYFRDFFARMRPGELLVLDNCHECSGTVFDDILREACQEIPDEIGLIAISRAEPPATLTRLATHGSLAVLHADQLRLTYDEAKGIVAASGYAVEEARSLFELADGWAAGLTLLLESGVRGTRLPGTVDRRSKDAVFAYFAGEVFDRSAPATQELLLCTSLFPEVTPEMAAAITGNPEAGKILDGLYRHNYFTTRKGEPELTYQYHDLFRDFLRARMEEEYSSVRANEVHREAARILEITGRIEDAVNHSVVAGDWQSVSRLIREHGEALLDQGRWQTLRQWLSAVTDAAMAVDPWLRYWLAMVTVQTSPDESIPHFEAAYEGFVRQGDRIGGACCSVGVCAAIYYSYDDYARFDRWVPVIEEFMGTPDCTPGSLLEARAVTALVNAAYHRGGDERSFRQLAAHAIRCLRAPLPAMQRVETATRLLIPLALRSDLDLAREVIAIAGPVAATPGFPTLQRSWWDWAVANYFVMLGDREAALLRFDATIASSREYGSRGPLLVALVRKLLVTSNSANQMETIAGLLQDIERIADPARPLQEVALCMARGYAIFYSGATATDIDLGRRYVAAAEKSGAVNVRYAARLLLSLALARAGDTDGAVRECMAAGEMIADTCLWPARGYQGLREAALLLKIGRREEARRPLREALEIIAERQALGYVSWAWFYIEGVFEFALLEGIEVELCKKIVRHFDLVPALPRPDWPWSVKVRALGGFAVETDRRDGAPSGRKAPHRLLDLLKAIVALGPDATVEHLAESLWPDAQGDQGQTNLASSMHRLRKLLGRDVAIVQREGRVSINERLCWVDTRAFESLVARLPDAEDIADPGAVRIAEQAYGLYGGHLLDGESHSWSTAARERLRAKYQRLALALAAAYESSGSASAACAVYERLLELEPASEACYRRYMSCLKRNGRVAEARDVYQRCRRVLAATMAAMPSADTLAVFESLQGSSEST